MQGVLFFLLFFFAACWILVAGYHLNLDSFVTLASTATGSSTMIVAYAGTALSVVFVVMVTLATMTKK